MKKLFIVLLTVCIAFSITACAKGADPVVDNTVVDDVPSIDRYDIEAIIVQYENSGQYYFSGEEIDEFVELYNRPDSYKSGEEELGEEDYVIVVSYSNSDYLLMDKYTNADYDFTVAEYIEFDSIRNPNASFLIINAKLAAFTDKVVKEQFVSK